MTQVNTEKLKPGMRLSEPIFNDSGTIELLGRGTALTERHINLLKRLGVDGVKISDEADELDIRSSTEPISVQKQTETIMKTAEETGHDFDAQAFQKDLEELENEPYEEVVTNVANANMVINVLTGEGNVPIDVKHEAALKKTKEIFEELRDSNDLNLGAVREGIEETLPDMIRNNDVLMRLSQLKETHDQTFEHCLRVSILATMIGKWLGYSKEKLVELGQAAILFDIGMMKIPSFLLAKVKPIDDDEFEVIKRHAQFGYSILLKTQGITNNIKYSALQHHERLDGSGYPLRLQSGQIHEFAKIIMVCDIFDAMTSDRPYRKKMSPFQAAEYISWQSGNTLDPKICYIFLSNLSEFFVGKKVRLSTGQEGLIVYVDANFPTRPVVKVEEEFIDLAKDRDIQIDEIVS